MNTETNIFDCHPLFEDVQLQSVFPDGKTFVDCVPKSSLASINKQYIEQKDKAGFNLQAFVMAHFDLPHVFAGDYKTDTNKSTTEHINELWAVLTRQPDTSMGSLIPLPNPYIVPGGRFGEVYYWDSYFTMLGLACSGRIDMVENMVANFAHLINTVGFIPNGNRTYYLGRSQPPFFSLMVQLLASKRGNNILIEYLPWLLKEYEYWMKGATALSDTNRPNRHCIKLQDGEVLNRYFDAFDTARPESYKEDVELSHQSSQQPALLYSNLRAGAESGWDYSSRWFKDGNSFASIHATEIIPVDLNSLLYYLEHTISEAFFLNGDESEGCKYSLLAKTRKGAILKYCWSNSAGFFVDYDWTSGTQKQEITLAALTPLYFKLATQQQADLVAEKVQAHFLKAGGLVTTLKNTGQQWDAPNGWAPLQWMSIAGLENYGHHALSKTIAQRWTRLNTDVYERTGKLMEKYNVVDTHLDAGGGEYAGQDGFGWTNGVYLALMDKYGL